MLGDDNMPKQENIVNNDAKMEHLLKSIEQNKINDNEENAEIPPVLLVSLIEWMRKKGISDEDIVDCMLYICKDI